ncbi:MAG: DUF3597 domain-containing protein [Acetobacter sp.]|nr:DUF3597 domain-containing protein [Acetobacter sp.]
MSIFGKIVSAIFGQAHAGTTDPATSATTAPAETPAAATGSTAAPAAVSVDVDAVLAGLAAKAGQPLNWKESIVDLLKLLGMDSSLEARRQLAAELHYSGDQHDSAAMNVWLIKEVRKKLTENGGKLPTSF